MSGKHISLFAGAGMTDIAAEAAGFKTTEVVEIDPFCQSILRVRYPQARLTSDVKDFKWDVPARQMYGSPGSYIRNTAPLLISGGFPCQDVSASGLRAGLSGDRSGLWGEFRRIIYEFHPDYVMIENSAMLRSRGLDQILVDLGRFGYDCRWECIPATAVGAPHVRDRIWILAWPGENPMPFGGGITFLNSDSNNRSGKMISGVVQYTDSEYPRRIPKGLWPTPTRADGSGGPGTTPKREGGRNLRTAIWQVEGNGRLDPAWVEWLMGLPAGWTDVSRSIAPHPGWEYDPFTCRTTSSNVPGRAQRIRVLGNGLVPQVAAIPLSWIGDINEPSITQARSDVA